MLSATVVAFLLFQSLHSRHALGVKTSLIVYESLVKRQGCAEKTGRRMPGPLLTRLDWALLCLSRMVHSACVLLFANCRDSVADVELNEQSIQLVGEKGEACASF